MTTTTTLDGGVGDNNNNDNNKASRAGDCCGGRGSSDGSGGCGGCGGCDRCTSTRVVVAGAARAGVVASGGPTTKSCVVRIALVCMACVLALALLLRPAASPRPHKRTRPLAHNMANGPPKVLSVTVAQSVHQTTQNPQHSRQPSPPSHRADPAAQHQRQHQKNDVAVEEAHKQGAQVPTSTTSARRPYVGKQASADPADAAEDAQATQAISPLTACKASLQARACPANPYAETAPEICRPTEPTALAIGNCHLEPVEVLTRAHHEYRWFLHLPPAHTLEPPLVLADEGEREVEAEVGSTPFVPAPHFRSWPSPGPVVLGFPREHGGPHFVDGSNGAVFNATHAYTNKRWHRVPSKRSVNSVLQADELGSRCSVTAAVREAPAALPLSSSAATQTGAQVVHVKGALVNLVVVWGDTFQHTVLEVLPRLSAFLAWLTSEDASAAEPSHTAGGASLGASTRDSLRAGKVPVTLLVYPGSKVLRSMLKALSELDGSPMSTAWELLPANPRATYTADTVIFPTLAGQQKIGVMPHNALCPLVPLLRRLQSRGAQDERESRRVQSVSAPPHGSDGVGDDDKVVLYLSRGEAAPRALLRETEASLVAALQRMVEEAGNGWRLELWDHDADHQWERDMVVFARARVIVGPHGGALSNLIFANVAGTTTGTAEAKYESTIPEAEEAARAHVVEFIPRSSLERPPTGGKGKGSDVRPCYLALAQALGMAYHQVEPTAFGFDRPHLDVDVGNVVRTVRSSMRSYDSNT